MRLRAVADEVYALLEGEIQCAWLDLRESSPGHERFVLTTFSDPVLLLVPFGVAFGLQAVGQPALVLRTATHSIQEKDDLQQIPWRGRP